MEVWTYLEGLVAFAKAVNYAQTGNKERRRYTELVRVGGTRWLWRGRMRLETYFGTKEPRERTRGSDGLTESS
jgi:hypothetical protein